MFSILTKLVFAYKECWEAERIPLKAINSMNYAREKREDKGPPHPGNKLTRTNTTEFTVEKNHPSSVNSNTLRRQFGVLQDNLPMTPKPNTRPNIILQK